jgi:hypothetical protein
MFASSLFILRSSSSRALAFRKSDMKVVRPLMVDMLSVEKRLAGPPPPGLRIVVARFRVVDDGDDSDDDEKVESKWRRKHQPDTRTTTTVGRLNI